MLTLLKIIGLAWWVWIASCGLPSVRSAPPAVAPVAEPPRAESPESTSPAIDPAIDALLTRIESSAKDLASFAAKIAYEKEDAILLRTETRTGEIIYQIEGDQKRFAVLFDRRIIPPRADARLYHYVFDGRWLAEIDHENKQFIKREIVAPGQTLDPLKLGEGPFPLPIGQAKADVLARFDVALLPDVPADGLLKPLKDVDGLALTPKAGTVEAREYQRIDIYYDRATSLPLGINAIEINDDRKTVRLSDLKLNPALDEAALKKLSIAEPDPRQWKIDIRPWGATP